MHVIYYIVYITPQYIVQNRTQRTSFYMQAVAQRNNTHSLAWAFSYVLGLPQCHNLININRKKTNIGVRLTW